MLLHIYLLNLLYTKYKKNSSPLSIISISLPDSLQPSLCTTDFNRSDYTSSRRRSSGRAQSPANLLQPINGDRRRRKTRNSRSKCMTQARFRCHFSLSPPQRPSSNSDLLTTLLDRSDPRQLRCEQPHPR